MADHNWSGLRKCSGCLSDDFPNEYVRADLFKITLDRAECRINTLVTPYKRHQSGKITRILLQLVKLPNQICRMIISSVQRVYKVFGLVS